MIAWLLLSLILCLPAWAAEWSGSLKGFINGVSPANITGLNANTTAGVSLRARLNGTGNLSETLRWEFAYDLVPLLQSTSTGTGTGTGTADSFRSTQSVPYRVVDFSSAAWNPEGDFILLHNVDRFQLTYEASGFDLFIGRQAIAFGSARAVNPTDVFAPFNVNSLDQEYRSGIDGLRLQVPLGELSELDLGWLTGREFSLTESGAFARYQTHIQGQDIALLYAHFQTNHLLGLDVQSAVGPVGIWLEGAYTFRGRDSPFTKDFTRFTLGADSRPAEKWYVLLEYHFSSLGQTDPAQYSMTVSDTPSVVYLLGKHYLIPGATYQITDLTSLSASLLLNLSDGSALVLPAIEYNLSQNLYVSAGAFLGLGAGAQISNNQLSANSEFGLYPDFYYLSVRWYL